MFSKKKLTLCVLTLGIALSACQDHQKSTDSKDHQEVKVDNALDISLDSTQMMAHLKAFEQIATQHQGNRAVGSSGGIASGDYILAYAKQLGYATQVQSFKNHQQLTGRNIIVTIPGTLKEPQLLIGAHYDSVKMGPGINDNASGVALLLELMRSLASSKQPLQHTIYLAFWDSEEEGIAGSRDYVAKLSPEQLQQIKAYINVDMVGTKDPEILIADGDRSSIDEMEKMLRERGMTENDFKPIIEGLRSIPVHAKDAALENSLQQFFKDKNLKIKEDVSILTASDTAAFLGKVPVTGLVLFNEKLQGDELEFAPCYHKACDTLELIDPESMKLAGEALMHLLRSLDAQ
ncbi:M20/M25/M40 family metallo-hydrolase [Acinetobacter larvae]|uniref:Aminopeptidase n=1 Tax=Acinetobacter larvae TaxID=1789224 RepID=A0A1B2M133_9GAMM|nr:M20/M25/M40 family metallo-hydrolase [Acinetobacter larvae]AOA58871.1 aminopeptidase [Acinetobacter larvae]